MRKNQWGPHFWFTIHYAALGYPDKPSITDKRKYKTFFENLGYVIPCSKCSKNYMIHTKDLPIEPFLENKDSLFKWTVILHNTVNKEIGKPQWNKEIVEANLMSHQYIPNPNQHCTSEKRDNDDDNNFEISNKKRCTFWSTCVFLLVLYIVSCIILCIVLIKKRKLVF